jgi:signal transduction histidine kinase/DNA-binding response OmpR family regulator
VTTDAQGQRWALAGRYLLRLNGGDASIAWSTGGPELWSLFTDPTAPNALWLGDTQGGVYRFDRERATVTDRYTTDGRVHRVHRGPRNRLWIGTANGLWRVDATGAVSAVRDPALDGQPVRDLFNAPNGTLWAATAGGGLVRICGAEVRALTTRHGLPSDHLSAVVLDAQGFFWLSGRQALYRLRHDDATAVLDGQRARVVVVPLLPSAGHLGSSTKLAEVAQAADGSLWIPSFKGVTRLDPAQYAAQFDEPLPLHVEALATEQGGGQPLRADMQLPVGQRTVTLRYTAPDLRAPGLVQFRTRLRGRDAAWVNQGPRRSVTYGALPPGAYTFEVQAMNAGGVWNSPVATLAFAVPPRVTETWWFFGLCALGLLAVAALSNRLRVQSLVRRQRELNALVDERTDELRAEKETVLAQADALRALDQAKSRVFANVSHEFRTPLTLTLGPLDDLADGLHGPLPSPVVEQVALARRNARRVLDLINQLLDVARLESGQVRLCARRLDLAEIVADVAETFAPLAERKAITLDVRCPEARASATPPTTVWANPEQLHHILANLFSNALKFTPEGGCVRLTVAVQADTLTVVVRDSGPGISAEDLPHVFDRFYRAGETGGPRRVGSGIGLALTKELVDLHHGTITVESEEGFGSQFTVALPRGRDHLRPSEIADPNDDGASTPSHGDSLPALAVGTVGDSVPDAAPPGGNDAADDADDRTTVLLVDDNAEVRTYLRRHLAADYRILEAANGAVGLERARTDLPDLVLSDVMMPEMDGVALCRALKSDPATEFIPVVLLTARAEIEDRVEGLDEGADDYLTKPFNTAEVRARVRNLIRSRQHLRAHLPTSPGLLATPDVPSVDRRFIEEVQSAIEARMSDEAFAVTDLAEAVGLSRTHLYRRLQDVVDASPSALIRAMRLQRAAHLLAQDAGSVSEIAYAVGFKSVSHFSRSFRETFGHPPSSHATEAAAT